MINCSSCQERWIMHHSLSDWFSVLRFTLCEDFCGIFIALINWWVKVWRLRIAAALWFKWLSGTWRWCLVALSFPSHCWMVFVRQISFCGGSWYTCLTESISIPRKTNTKCICMDQQCFLMPPWTQVVGLKCP